MHGHLMDNRIWRRGIITKRLRHRRRLHMAKWLRHSLRGRSRDRESRDRWSRDRWGRDRWSRDRWSRDIAKS